MYDQEEFTGNQYVLEEGIYPDLTAMGCSPQAVLKSLQIINIVSKAIRNIVEKYTDESDLPVFATEKLLGMRRQWRSISFFLFYAVAVKCPSCSQVFLPQCCFCEGKDITEPAAWHHSS